MANIPKYAIPVILISTNDRLLDVVPFAVAADVVVCIHRRVLTSLPAPNGLAPELRAQSILNIQHSTNTQGKTF